ncbi:PAS domain S-box protein, partial [bacterium]|nr:PAS domain S-box protein [bacterium]
EQLIIEPQELCQITTELEESEAQHKQTDEALQESEERYKALFDRSLYFVYVHDFEGNFLDANKATLNLLGYTKKDISSLSFSSLLDEEQLPIAIKSLGEILKNGYQKNPTKFKLKTKKGDYVWVETEASLIYRKGKPYAVQGIARDITKSILAEEALQESKEKYRTLAENAMDGIYIICPEEGFEYVNSAFEKIFGYKAEEVCKKDFNFFDLIYPDDRKLILEREKARKKGKRLPPVYSFRILTKNGNTKNVEVNTVPLPGKKVRILGILRDVTQRTQAEEALRVSEEKFKCITSSAKDAIIMMDDEGNICNWNKAAEETFGYSAQEALGKELHTFLAPQQYHDASRKGIGTFKTTGQGLVVSKTLELEAVKKDGTIFPIELSV